MELGAIFLTLSVIVITGLFITRPFWEDRRARSISAEEHQLSSLLAERDRLLTALQELDFDHTLGKIPAEDYPNMRAELLRMASETLRKLDEAQAGSPASDAESRIEAAIAARRADSAAHASPLSEDDLEERIAARRANRKEKSGGFCPKCGKPVLQSDRFCPSCGKPIS
jgi:rubrerythrin